MTESPPTAGYSGTPLPKKLGIREGSLVALVEAPDRFLQTLGQLPGGVRIVGPREGPVDVLVFFVTDHAELAVRLPEVAGRLKANGGLWVAWPKKRSGVPSNLGENGVRELGLAAGLVDNKVCAIDGRWSGLRFVYRLKDRPSLPR